MLNHIKSAIESRLLRNGLEMKLPLGPVSWPFHYLRSHLLPLPLTRLGIMLNRDPVKLRNYRDRDRLDSDARKEIVSRQYYRKLGKELHLNPPVSFTEKLNYQKLFYEDPNLPRCCDKFQLKRYLAEKLGEGFSAGTLFSSDRFTEKDFDQLPDSFVLKVNWSSGYNIMVHDKSKLSKRERRLIAAQLREWTRPHSNSYYYSFYLGYRDVKPVIFAEEMLPPPFLKQEYKVFCFSGKPEFVLLEIAPDSPNHRRACVDLSGKKLPFSFGEEPVTDQYELPPNFSEIIRTAAVLAEGFPFVRVDYLTDGKRLVIGEMTFYSGGGLSIVQPAEWDDRLGSLFEL